jgi:hypothetical protein
MSDLIFTDVKYDDLLAIQIYLLRGRHTCREHDTVTIVLTNVVDKGRAAGLLKHHFGQAIFVMDDGDKVREPKSHEGMFAPYTSFDIVDYPRSATYKRVFMLSPIPDGCRQTLQRADEVFMGLGYNTTGMDVDFLSTLTRVVIMNNMSQTIYRDGEGGRFESNDNEVFRHVDAVNPGFTKLRQDARKDSIAFMIRQLAKCGVPDITEDNLFTLDTLQKAQDAPNSNRYMPRVIDQLRRKTVDVECTDGQHMALWLCADEYIKPVHLVQGPGFIEIEPSADPGSTQESKFWAPCGMTRGAMRECFIHATNICNRARWATTCG